MEIKCFTDGSCLDKLNSVGAWAYKIITDENNAYINYGTQVGTTSSLMEAEAIKQSLLYLNEIKNDFNNIRIIVYSDCKTVVENLNKVINKEKVKTKAKMKFIYNEITNIINATGINVLFQWIKGHNSKSKEAESLHNNDVDKIARENARILAKELKIKKNNNKKKKKKVNNCDEVKVILTKQPSDMEKYIEYNKIIIPYCMQNTAPKESKITAKFNIYKENNGVGKAIEVKKIGKKYMIVDGYISYLWLRESGEYWIPIKNKI